VMKGGFEVVIATEQSEGLLLDGVHCFGLYRVEL
jgi:hypothetical protein